MVSESYRQPEQAFQSGDELQTVEFDRRRIGLEAMLQDQAGVTLGARPVDCFLDLAERQSTRIENEWFSQLCNLTNESFIENTGWMHHQEVDVELLLNEIATLRIVDHATHRQALALGALNHGRDHVKVGIDRFQVAIDVVNIAAAGHALGT